MRKVAYISISVVLLMLTYFITYFVLLNDKQNQVYNEIVEVSKNTNDYENFLKYQPVMHKEIELKSVITSGFQSSIS